MAASNVNVVVITGNLTRDPELRHTGGGTAVCDLRVAVNSRRKDESGNWVDKPNYFDVTVWGAQGENCAQYLAKGRPVAIDGRLDWREWETQDGNKREAVEQGKLAFDIEPHDTDELVRIEDVFRQAGAAQEGVRAAEARAALLAERGGPAEAVPAWLAVAELWRSHKRTDAAAAAASSVERPYVRIRQEVAENLIKRGIVGYADRLRVQPGETLFVHGASGGVGLAATQIARAAGLRVIGTASTPAGRDVVSAQGAEHVLDHREAGYLDTLHELTGGRGPDVILESLANVNLDNDLTVIAPRGRLVWITPAVKRTTPVAEQLGLRRTRSLDVDLGGVRGQLERWER